MDLVPALPLPNGLNSASSERSLTLDVAGFDKVNGLAPETEHQQHKKAGAGHFADILGQTLAGPLFATWTPTPDLIATNKPAANQTAMAALDPNGRRDGRKRSRR